MNEARARNFHQWFGPSNLFSTGVFCLALGIFLGGKVVAAGHIILVLSFVGVALQREDHRIEWKTIPMSGWWLAVFMVVAALSIVANRELIEDPLDFCKRLRYLLIPLSALLIPGLSREIEEKKWRRDVLVAGCLLSMGFAILIGFITWWTGVHPFRYIDPIYTWRLSGLLGHTMTFSYVLQFSVVALAGFVMAPALWKEVTRIPWWVAVVSLVIGSGAMYLTYTRGAMLGVVVGFITFALLRSFKLVLVLLMVGIVGGVFAYFDSEGWRYFYLSDPVRVNQWKTAAMSFLERPTFGLGFRNFEIYSVELKERYGIEKDTVDLAGVPVYFQGHAHNNFLEAFASTGVFGGIAFLGFCYCWLKESLRSRYALIFVPLIATFLVSGLFENTFFDSEVLNCILLIYLFSQWAIRRENNSLIPASRGRCQSSRWSIFCVHRRGTLASSATGVEEDANLP